MPLNTIPIVLNTSMDTARWQKHIYCGYCNSKKDYEPCGLSCQTPQSI